MKHLKWLILPLVFILVGCATKTSYINKAEDRGHPVLALDYRDFDTAIKEVVDSLVASGILKKADKTKYVATTGGIVNDTTQNIDTRQLMSSVEEQLINANLVDMTSAVGDATDTMITKDRALRENEEFNPGTIAAKGTLIAPEISFSGKIFQRDISYDKKTNQIEYYIQLIVTDLKTGVRLWQKQVQILKRGSSKTVIW